MGSYTDLSSVLISIHHGSHGHHEVTLVTPGSSWQHFSASCTGMSNGIEKNKAVQVWFVAVLGGYFPGFPLDQHWEGCEGVFSPEQSMKQGRTRRYRAQPSSALIFITNKDPV